MKRLTLFCGHYGSGKTNIAVNYAFYLKSQGYDTAIADLDIVNPYFRTKDSEKELNEAGIQVISLPFANTSVDLPGVPSESYSLIQNYSRYSVFDIGGDDRGSYVLGRFAPFIKEENNYDNLLVVNFYRPLTQTPEDTAMIMKEIEEACHIPFTGIVNNTNIGELTTAEIITESQKKAEELSHITSLPVVMTSVREDLAKSLDIENIFPLKLQKKYW